MDQEIFFFFQILLAVILGGVLGWQRELSERPAGIRTYALVTAGSTLFTILSLHAFAGAATDSSRLASQIVVGIGFIGAGTIMHRSNHIEGLTTAAGLWISAAIGVAIGVEYIRLAMLTTLLVLLLFVMDEKKWLLKKINGDSSKPAPPKRSLEKLIAADTQTRK